MNKMQWIGWAAALSVASAPMTAFAFCSNSRTIVNGRTGNVKCDSGGDQGEGNIVFNTSTFAGFGGAFLRAGTVSARMEGLDQFSFSKCLIQDLAPQDAFSVTRSVTCTNAVTGRITVD
jgi:hypothetical protein